MSVLFRRIFTTLGVVIVLALVVFMLQRLAPGDPARALAGPRATETQIAEKRIQLGLDKSLPEQFVVYIKSLARGDLGTSSVTGNSVAGDIKDYGPATLELVIASFALAIGLGLLFGVLAVARPRAAVVTRFGSVFLASCPPYVIAIVLLLALGVWVDVLPTDGRIDPSYVIDGPTGMLTLDSVLAGNPGAFVSAVWHLLLPAVAVALVPAVAISRTLRATLSQSMSEDYVLAARSKGLGDWTVIWRHALRNSIGPVLAVAGLQLAAMVGNVVVVEQLLSWGGLGQYLVNALSLLDYAAVLGVVLVLGLVYVLLNMAIDSLQILADPRLRVLGAKDPDGSSNLASNRS